MAPTAPAREAEMQDTPPCHGPKTSRKRRWPHAWSRTKRPGVQLNVTKSRYKPHSMRRCAIISIQDGQSKPPAKPEA